MTPGVSNYDLFPTRLVAIQHDGVADLNGALGELFDGPAAFAAGFNMHPDAMNLLELADAVPAIARLRDLFVDGVKRWLQLEGARDATGADLVMFSNYAARGEMTLVHNHNADLVGIYYARTADHDGDPVQSSDPDDDYFEAGDGDLILHDPRFNANLAGTGHRDYLKVRPKPGLMLIFPGYLWHSVTPHLGSFRRLSLSVNATLRRPTDRRPTTVEF